MAVRMGVIDSGYRGEIIIGINNTGNKTVVISKDIEKTKQVIKDTLGFAYSEELIERTYIFYPYEKAIAQLILIPIPQVQTEEISYEELLQMESERGAGKLGSSGK